MVHEPKAAVVPSVLPAVASPTQTQPANRGSSPALDPPDLSGPSQPDNVDMHLNMDMGDGLRETTPEGSLQVYRPDMTGSDTTPPKPQIPAPRTPKKRVRALSNGGEQNLAKVSIL